MSSPQTQRLLLYLVIVTNTISIATINPILYKFATELGINGSLASVFYTAYGVSQFFAAPMLGRISDHIGRKKVLLVCTLGTVIASLVQAVVTVVPVLFAARILDGVTGGNNSVANAALADKSSEDERYKVFSYANGAFGVGFIGGSLLSWYLARFGIQVPFFGAAGMASVSTLLLFFFLHEERREGETKGTLDLLGELTRVFANIYQALKSKRFHQYYLFMFFYALAVGMYVYANQPYILEELGLAQGYVNLLTGVFGAANVLAIVVVPWLKKQYSTALLLYVVCALTVGAFAGMPGGMLRFLGFAGVIAVVNAFVRPLLNGLVSQESESDEQGENIGNLSSFFGLGFSLGPLLGGLLIASFWTGLPYYVAAGLVAGVGVYLWWQLRSARKS